MVFTGIASVVYGTPDPALASLAKDLSRDRGVTLDKASAGKP